MMTTKSGSRLMNVARKIKQLVLGSKNPSGFPVFITLQTPQCALKFEAFSPVEHYRIADYGDEKFFIEKFTESIKLDDIVFDIGASVGLMTVHAAVFTRKGQVFAFEPDPETSERLKHNVLLNSLSNVSFLSWAASDQSGEVVLFSDGASGLAPTMREQTNREGAPKNRVTVQTRTLDDEILNGNLLLPTVLKIDIEGAEVLCLRGAKKLLSGQLGEKPRLIFLELHPEFLPSFGAKDEEVHAFVLGFGYSVVWEQKRDNQIHYCYQSI